MNDPEIRQLLYPLLTEGCIIDELPVGSTRADVLHLTSDFMHGYEVKGDGDTLKRLENQVKCYRQSFDFVTFVVTSKHVQKALAMLPEWAGLWCATPTGIVPMRRAVSHGQLDKAHTLSLLRQGEVKYFVQQHGLKGISRLRDWELWEVLRADTTIPLSTIAAFVRERLIARLPERLAQRAQLKAEREAAKQRDEERLADRQRIEALGRHLLHLA